MTQTSELSQWLRQVTPYLNLHRNRTFIIACSEPCEQNIETLGQELTLLHSLGIRVVLILGLNITLDAITNTNLDSSQENCNFPVLTGLQLQSLKKQMGKLYFDVQAQLSIGLADIASPHASPAIVTGNFITAKPLGILNGTDHLHYGRVRRVHHQRIQSALDAHQIVVLNSLGHSPSGKSFYLNYAEIATRSATVLNADKLIFLSPDRPTLPHEMTAQEVEQWLCQTQVSSSSIQSYGQVQHALDAIHQGVPRVHLLSTQTENALFTELFTHQGIGTLISQNHIAQPRSANSSDILGILALIRPLIAQEILLARDFPRIERDIEQFTVIEHDGLRVACAALYCYPEQNSAELACLAVHPDYQLAGYSQLLLHYLEQKAQQQHLKYLLVLTTQTMDWFQEHGFRPWPLSALPPKRQAQYTESQRQAQLLCKTLIHSDSD